MSIHPTDTTTRCPKCGYGSASFRYEPGPQRYHTFSATNEPCTESDEHMHRQCLQCTYEWSEPIVTPDEPVAEFSTVTHGLGDLDGKFVPMFEHKAGAPCETCYPGKVVVHDDGKRHWRGSPCAKCDLQEETDAAPLP